MFIKERVQSAIRDTGQRAERESIEEGSSIVFFPF